MELNFWLTLVICLGVNFSISYSTGLLVRHKNVKVNYTRKINHFALFFFPIFLNNIFTFEKTLTGTVIRMGVMVVSLLIYIEPVRNRIDIIKTAFLSFDRPEDRPHTWDTPVLYTVSGVTLSAIMMM